MLNSGLCTDRIIIAANDDAKNEFDLMLIAAKLNPDAVKWASAELLSNKDFALEMMLVSNHTIQYFSHDIRTNKDIMISAIGNSYGTYDIDIIQYGTAELRESREFFEQCAIDDIYTGDELPIKHASLSLQIDFKYIEKLAVLDEENIESNNSRYREFGYHKWCTMCEAANKSDEILSVFKKPGLIPILKGVDRNVIITTVKKLQTRVGNEWVREVAATFGSLLRSIKQ